MTIDTEITKKNDIAVNELMASSDESQEMKGQINLNPLFIQPPQSPPDEFSFYPGLSSGRPFSSYFEGKRFGADTGARG
ncbi:MAG: hypothetical protein R2860_16195 [Desulfobacterales bacterium]